MSKLRAWLPALFLTAALVLGGASAGGVVVNALLQLFALLLLTAIAVSGRLPRLVSSERQLLLILGSIALVALLQLIPLPRVIYAGSPGRALVEQGFNFVGLTTSTYPISLWPAATIAAFPFFFPVFAGVLCVAIAGSNGLRAFAWLLGITAATSFAIGLLQVTGGPNSPLYFYQVTNNDQPVGFFANSNHLATLGVMSLPFLAALAARDASGVDAVDRKLGDWVAIGALACFIVLGVVMDGSVAGLALLIPSMLGSFIILRVERGSAALPLISIVVVATVTLFVVIAMSSPILNGFASTDLGTGTSSRAEIFRNTLGAIRAFLPFGTGLGSFILVYPRFSPSDVATVFYVPHAHNEALQIALEAGLPGIIITLVFLLWWTRRAIFAWRQGGVRARFARAASVSSLLMMAHSLVDFPGRNAALQVLFVMCAAIMARPLATVTPQMFAKTAQRSRGKMVDADV